MTDFEFTNHVAVFLNARAAEKRNKEEKDNASLRIRAEMQNRGVDSLWVSLTDKDYKVSFKNYTKTIFDRQRFMTENPQLYSQYMKDITVRQLNVE